MKERKELYTISSSFINQYNLHEMFCVRDRKQRLSGNVKMSTTRRAAASSERQRRQREARRGEARVLGEAAAGQERTRDALMAKA